MDLAEEAALVAQAKSDIQAFALLYDAYYPRIFGYVLRRTADVTLAQDITSEIFYKALRHVQSFQWRNIPFSAWLYRVAGNEITESYRRNGHTRRLQDELKHALAAAQAPVEVEIEQAERELQKQRELLALHDIIRRLPPQYQEAITLRYFEKKSLSEMGAILGRGEGAVKSLLHRALVKMGEFMRRETF
jgi:RNA polymerase sigma-70 factor (ECF subfamily)